MFALLGLPIDVAYHLVSALAGAFTPLLGGLAVAAAIVLFTIMVRLLVLPLSYYAFRGQRAQARIAPQIQELYKRHSGQPERLQRELSALRAREGAGMFTGCLPALLQIPFFTVIYRLFLSGTVGGSPNLLLHQHLFSASLGSHWLTGAGLWSGGDGSGKPGALGEQGNEQVRQRDGGQRHQPGRLPVGQEREGLPGGVAGEGRQDAAEHRDHVDLRARPRGRDGPRPVQAQRTPGRLMA